MQGAPDMLTHKKTGHVILIVPARVLLLKPVKPCTSSLNIASVDAD